MFFLFLVRKTLTGFLPATSRAPLIPVFHSIHFTAFSRLPSAFPKDAHIKHNHNIHSFDVRHIDTFVQLFCD